MSDKFNNPLKYRVHNEGPITLDEIMDIYRENKIDLTKCELYRDFILTLCDTIFETYLGDELTPKENRLEHFMWCWDNTIDKYFKLGYDLTCEGDKEKYFGKFFFEMFYENTIKNYELEKDIKLVWNYIFNFYIIKPRRDVYNFIKLYNMFDNTNWFKK
jgi:hypothetical protein